MKRSGMQMDDYEIVQSYKNAKSKSEQLKILADLNCTTVDMIKNILHENGVTTQGKPAKPKVAPVQQEVQDAPKTAPTACQPADPVDVWKEKQRENIGMFTAALIDALKPVKSEICNHYCKYADLLKKTDKHIYEDLLKDICGKCPLL